MRYCFTQTKHVVRYDDEPKVETPTRVLTHNEFDALPDDVQARLIERDLRGDAPLQLLYAM